MSGTTVREAPVAEKQPTARREAPSKTPAGGRTDGRRIRRIWARFARTRSDRLRRVLLDHYLSLVRRIAGRQARGLPAGVDTDDLVQEGYFGLADAIDRFDPHQGVPFGAFAGRHISGAMVDYLRSLDHVSRLARERSKQLESARRDFRQRYGYPPNEQELAESLGLDHEALERLHTADRMVHGARQVSMDAAPRTDDSPHPASPAAMIEAKNVPDPLQEAQRRDLKRYLTRSMSRVEQLIVVLYYYEKLPMRAVGEALGMSESRVCQIHKLVVAQLKAKLTKRCQERMP